MLKKNTKVGILGGGLTGLTISANLRLANEVLEKENICGGLCRSYQAKGFTFDFGGSHIIYSKNIPALDCILGALAGNYSRQKLSNKIYFKERFINYPFENSLHELDEKDNAACLYFYLKNNYSQPGNFKEWLYSVFGKGIAERYLIPYNQKIWKHPLEKMDFLWAKERVPLPYQQNGSKTAKFMSERRDSREADFYYPLRGGIQALVDSLKKKTLGSIETDFEVKRIQKKKNKWIVSDGQREKAFDVLVSTIPVFDLISCLGTVAPGIKKALGDLRYNSLITVMIGTRQRKNSNFFATYFPQKEFLFHRLSFPQAFSRNNAPEGEFAVLAEITASFKSRLYRTTDREIMNKVVNDLHRIKIIDKRKICHCRVARTRYAYVIYDKDYRKNIAMIRSFVKDSGIELCGRFAEFEYLNMDACVERALRVVDRLNKITPGYSCREKAYEITDT